MPPARRPRPRSSTRDHKGGSGSELLQPMAICVIGGLLFALMLSLVVTPTITRC